MPEYRYAGAPGLYPHHRDRHGIPIGAVSPGDVRDLDEPLDPSWFPAGEHPHTDPADSEDGNEAGTGAPALPRRTRRTTQPDETPGGQTAGTEA